MGRYTSGPQLFSGANKSPVHLPAPLSLIRSCRVAKFTCTSVPHIPVQLDPAVVVVPFSGELGSLSYRTIADLIWPGHFVAQTGTPRFVILSLYGHIQRLFWSIVGARFQRIASLGNETRATNQPTLQARARSRRLCMSDCTISSKAEWADQAKCINARGTFLAIFQSMSFGLSALLDPLTYRSSSQAAVRYLVLCHCLCRVRPPEEGRKASLWTPDHTWRPLCNFKHPQA